MRKFIAVLTSWILIMAMVALSITVGIELPYPLRSTISASLNGECPVPRTVRLGSIDPQFQLSEERAIELIHEAFAPWNNSAGREVLSYSDRGEVDVNFIYTKDTAELEDRDKQQQDLEGELRELEQIRLALEEDIRKYNLDLLDYNIEVGKWNASGSSDMERFAELKAEQKKLEERKQELDERRYLYEQERAYYNRKIQDLQKSYYRQDVAGVFKGASDEIEVYIYRNETDLKWLLAHELGHALGISGHVEDEDAVMYRLAAGQHLFENNVILRQEDVEAMEAICNY